MFASSGLNPDGKTGQSGDYLKLAELGSLSVVSAGKVLCPLNLFHRTRP